MNKNEKTTKKQMIIFIIVSIVLLGIGFIGGFYNILENQHIMAHYGLQQQKLLIIIGLVLLRQKLA